METLRTGGRGVAIGVLSVVTGLAAGVLSGCGGSGGRNQRSGAVETCAGFGAEDARSTIEVERVLDRLHAAASEADGASYWSCFAPGAVFLGTDASERWTLEEFKAYAEPHFAKGRGWTYRKVKRWVTVHAAQTAWFDELLENAKYGTCRGSGVVVKGEDGGWRIAQYNLSVPIPNELLEGFAARIREHEAAKAAGTR